MTGDIVSRLLKRRGLVTYFRELVTPQGKINLLDQSVNPRYKGYTKKDGTLKLNLRAGRRRQDLLDILLYLAKED